jgi:hypothetical protein
MQYYYCAIIIVQLSLPESVPDFYNHTHFVDQVILFHFCESALWGKFSHFLRYGFFSFWTSCFHCDKFTVYFQWEFFVPELFTYLDYMKYMSYLMGSIHCTYSTNPCMWQLNVTFFCFHFLIGSQIKFLGFLANCVLYIFFYWCLLVYYSKSLWGRIFLFARSAAGRTEFSWCEDLDFFKDLDQR